MIEFIKKYGIGFLLSAIIFGPLGYVTATTIAARNITYNGANTNSSLTDVQAAIEELYSLSEKPVPQSITIVVDGSSVGYGATGANFSLAEQCGPEFNDNMLNVTVNYNNSTSKRIYRSEYTLADSNVQVKSGYSNRDQYFEFTNTLTYTENNTTIQQEFTYYSMHDGGPCSTGPTGPAI